MCKSSLERQAGVEIEVTPEMVEECVEDRQWRERVFITMKVEVLCVLEGWRDGDDDLKYLSPSKAASLACLRATRAASEIELPPLSPAPSHEGPERPKPRKERSRPNRQQRRKKADARYVPDAAEALAQLHELASWSHELDVAECFRRLIDEGAPLMRANVDAATVVATGDTIVRYEIAEPLQVCLATVRARHIETTDKK